jgi:hypothetical protein
VHNDHHFVVGGNFYSVPTIHIGREVQIRVGLKTIKAYENHVLIKTHVRNYGAGQWVTDQNDYHDSAQFYLENTATVCLEKAKAIGQATETMIKQVLVDRTRTSLRKSHAILRLGEEYGSERLEAACLRAVTFDNYTHKSLKEILAKGLDKKDTKTFSTKKAANAGDFAYLRPASDYASTMEDHL